MRVLGLILLVILGLGMTTYSEAVAGTQFEHLNLSKRAKKKAKKAWQSNPKAKAVFEAISSMQGIYTERAMSVLLGLTHEWSNNDLALDFLGVFSKEGGDAAVKFMEAHLSEAYKQYMRDPNSRESKEFYSNLTELWGSGSYQNFTVFLFHAGDVCSSRALNSVINFFTQMQGNSELIFSSRLLMLLTSAKEGAPNFFYATIYTALKQIEREGYLEEKNDKFYNHEQCVGRMRDLTLRLVCPKYFNFEHSKPDSKRRNNNLQGNKAFCKEIGVPLPSAI